jgi:hypothetical protein
MLNALLPRLPQRLDVAAAARKWLAVTRRNRKTHEIRQQDVDDFASLPPMLSHQLQNEEQSLLAAQQHSFGTFDTGKRALLAALYLQELVTDSTTHALWSICS